MSVNPSSALDVVDLDVAYRVRGRERQVLRGISFSIAKGESYGLVGESGCGKSTVAFTIVRHLARNGRIRSGRVLVDGRDLLTLSRAELREMRSKSGLDGLPGSRPRTQPLDPRRAPDRGGVRGAGR